MSRRAALAACAWLAIFARMASGQAEISKTFRVGIAAREFNPARPTVVIGPASSPFHAERYNDLKAKATVVEDAAGRRVAIVSADILYIPGPMVDELKAEIRRLHGLAPEAVLVNASHSHSGPPLEELMVDTPAKVDPELVARFKAQVVGAVGDAIAAMRPATISLSGDECGFAINRRLQVGGETQMLPNPAGSADRDVAVLAYRDAATGELFGLSVKYACHPVTMSIIGLGSDYPGFMMDEVERRHAGAVAQFLQGCCGDCRPAMVDEKVTKFIPGTLELCKGFGARLAEAVERALAKPGLMIEGGVDWRAAEVALPIRPADRAELESFAQSDAWFLRRWATGALERLGRGEALPSAVPMRIQAIQLGEGSLDFASIRLLALGGEVFSGYAIALRSRPYPWLNVALGYSNGMAGYIPTAAEIPKGGYEITAYRVWNAPGPFLPETEKIILDAAEKMARELVGRER